MKSRPFELLFASLLFARSTSFVIIGFGLRDLGVFNILALRSLIACAIMAVLFPGRIRRVSPSAIRHSAVMGFLFFGLLAAELLGFRRSDSSTVAFLENCAVVFIPLLTAMLHRRLPSPSAVAVTLLAMTGVALLVLRNGVSGLNGGAAFGILAALIYSIYVLVIERYAHEDDPLQIGILQNGFLGAFALAASLLTETPRLPQDGRELAFAVLLAVICSVFGLTLQPLAQEHVSSDRAAILCAMVPVSTALLGCLFLNERLGITGLIGAALIMASVLTPQAPAPSMAEDGAGNAPGAQS